MRISVVTGTYRLGGVDVVCQGIKKQSFTDFEYILVDSLYRQRKDLVEDYSRRIGVDDKLVHIPPPQGYSLPIRHIAPAYNQGVSRASGELIVVWSDFCYPHSQSLQRHWDVFTKSGGRVTTTGSYDYVSCPSLNPHLVTSLGRMSMPEYLAVAETRSDEFGITIFSKAFEPSDASQLHDSSTLANARYRLEIDYRQIGIGEPAPWYVWFSKNPSIPRDLFIKAGGVDNELGGWHDEFDLGLRLARLGHQMVYDPSNRVQIMTLVDIFPSTVTVRGRPESYAIWAKKRIGHGNLRFKETLSLEEVLKLRLRLLLLSPRVARILKKASLERLALMLIYTFSLGEPELKYVDDKAWLARF